MLDILVLYYSRHGAVGEMANHIARDEKELCQALGRRLATVALALARETG